MTRKEFIEKYGNETVVFTSYYKYSFVFEGKLKNGTDISISVGGYTDEIYRFSVQSGKEETVQSLEPYFGIVYREGNEVIDKFHDY